MNGNWIWVGGEGRYEFMLMGRAWFRKWLGLKTGLGHEPVAVFRWHSGIRWPSEAEPGRRGRDGILCVLNAVAPDNCVHSVSPLQVQYSEAHWADFTVLWHQNRHEEGMQTCQDVYESISCCWRTKWPRLRVSNCSNTARLEHRQAEKSKTLTTLRCPYLC